MKTKVKVNVNELRDILEKHFGGRVCVEAVVTAGERLDVGPGQSCSLILDLKAHNSIIKGEEMIEVIDEIPKDESKPELADVTADHICKLGGIYECDYQS